jgi:hypothetical protein
MELFHKPWTTGASVHGRPAFIAGWWSSPEPSLRSLWGSRPTTKGQGRGSGARGSRLGPHRTVSGNEAAQQQLKVRVGGELWHERGQKEGGVGCGEVRHGRGAFHRCRGGGRRPGDGEVKAVPLMAVHADYRKRGRWRRPIKEGYGERARWSASRRGTGDERWPGEARPGHEGWRSSVGLPEGGR